MTTQPTPTIVDLCALDDLKVWLKIDLSNTDDDSTLGRLITSFSQWVLNKTGVQSFNSIQSYDEIYDGNGAVRIFIRNIPIVSVTSIQIGATLIPASTGLTVSGYYIEPSKKSIALRTFGTNPTNFPAGATYTLTPYVFYPGNGNIEVKYTAGYSRVPTDLQEMAMKVLAITYRRKDYIDIAQKNLAATPGSGSTRYRDWDMPPECKEVLNFYTRYARS